MKTTLTIYFFMFWSMASFAQTKEIKKLPESQAGAFYKVSKPFSFNTVVEIEDLDIDPAALTRKAKFYALFIAVQDYKDPRLNNLLKPVLDAQNLREVLTKEYNFDFVNTQFLKNPTKKRLIDALDSLRNVIKPGLDNLLIFYAGHGYWDDGLETGYWLPADAKNDDKSNWISNQDLLTYFRSINTKHTLLITDACFSGSMFKATSRGKRKDLEEEFTDVLFERLYEKKSRRAITSGALTKVPDESLFLSYLIKTLRENKSVFLTALDLFIAIRNGVMRADEEINTPQYGELNLLDHEGGDFIFMKRQR